MSVKLYLLMCAALSAVSENEAVAQLFVDCESEYTSTENRLQNYSKDSNSDTPYTKQLESKIDQLLNKCPEHVGLRLIMANVKIATGNNLEGLHHASLALELDPNNPQAMNTKGMILSMHGKADEAVDLVKKSLKYDPDSPAFHLNYCSLLESYGRYEEAIEACSAAIKYQSNPARAYYIRGRSFEAMGEQDKAARDYLEAEKLGFISAAKKQDQ